MQLIRLRELRNRTEQALSELLGRTTYVVFSAELPMDTKLQHCGAMTSKWLTKELQPFIGGRWRGWGPSMIVNEQEIARYARELARGQPWRSARKMVIQEFVDACAHEAAHLLQFGWHREPDPGKMPAWIERQSRETVAILRAIPSVPLQELRVPWRHHDAKFLRHYCHVSDRLQKTLSIRSGLTFDTSVTGISPRWKYEVAIGDELQRLAHVPLGELGDIRPPEPFVELWRADVRKWWLGLAAPTAAQTQSLMTAVKLFT